MAESHHPLHSIVTTGGTDGACCAAALLMKHPDSPVFVTSQNAIHLALQSNANQEPTPEVVHVCGVGISNPEAVWDHLSDLKAAGAKVIWYCGREYLKPFKSMLSKVCIPIFENAYSNTEAVVDALKLSRTEQVKLLLDLAYEFSEQKKGSKEHQFWHDLIQAGSNQFFQFGYEDMFLKVLQKLAGRLAINDSDRSEVEHFRKSGTYKPMLLGTSDAIDRLRKTIGSLAPLEEPVLILGPSGSGKELVARALHDGSPRRDQVFHAVNCAILGTSPDLAYDRLFGHVAGAFTGATGTARGAFEAAAGGTLFLDEVAELPLGVQTQLLRVLEVKTICPHGTVDARSVDVRVIAATNKDLPREVGEGRFRVDLWYRLNVLPIEVPPFRERLEDAKAIANSLLDELTDQGRKPRLTEADWKAIRSYDWPGNVRQFCNLLKRAAYARMSIREALEQERRLTANAQHSADAAHASMLKLFLPSRPEDVVPEDEIRRAYMKHVLNLFHGNRTKACKALGMSENTLRKWVE